MSASACDYFAFAPQGGAEVSGTGWTDYTNDSQPISVTVPTGATSITITASASWTYLPGTGPFGPTGDPSVDQATVADYFTSALGSANIVGCTCNLGSLVGMWTPDDPASRGRR